QTFTTKQGRLNLADILDVVGDRRLESNDTTGIHPHHFAGTEILLQQGAARVHEGPAIALEALHDEPFTTEKTGADLLLEGDADGDPFGCTKERILLRDEFATHFREMHRHDFPRVGCAESDLLLAVAAVQ